MRSEGAPLDNEPILALASRADGPRADGRRVIHLDVGEPGWDTPAHIREAAKDAIDGGATRYVKATGTPELRQAIAKNLGTRLEEPADPDCVVVFPGAKAAIFLAILATCSPGDEVLVPDPGYPLFAEACRIAGATPVPFSTSGDSGHQPNAAAAAALITPRTRLLVLNAPSNPTGAIIAGSELEAFAGLAQAHDLLVLSDEIYSQFVFDGVHRSIAQLPGMGDRTILVDGFSKTYAMTGWRLGYAVVPRRLVEPLARLLFASASCTAPFIQAAGIRALEGSEGWVEARRGELIRHRDLAVEALNAIAGVKCPRPAGAMYVFPDVSGTGLDGDAFAERALTDAAVSLVPGSLFGARGRAHVRISIAASLPDLEEAMNRLHAVFARTEVDNAGGAST